MPKFAIDVAIGSKADMAFCGDMSAYDPRRTWLLGLRNLSLKSISPGLLGRGICMSGDDEPQRGFAAALSARRI
jgi:hypothetical protein